MLAAPNTVVGQLKSLGKGHWVSFVMRSDSGGSQGVTDGHPRCTRHYCGALVALRSQEALAAGCDSDSGAGGIGAAGTLCCGHPACGKASRAVVAGEVAAAATKGAPPSDSASSCSGCRAFRAACCRGAGAAGMRARLRAAGLALPGPEAEGDTAGAGVGWGGVRLGECVSVRGTAGSPTYKQAGGQQHSGLQQQAPTAHTRM